MKHILHSTIAIASVAAILGFQGAAIAQQTGVSEEPDPETPQGRARIMAENADVAIEQGKVAKGCRLYEMSLALHPDPGVELAFIECLTKMGLYGDAYGRMIDASARVEAGSESAKWAATRAEEIKKEAPCIMIDVPKALRNVRDLEVALDGIAIPPAAWNSVCTPVNLIYHNVTVKAPLMAWIPQRIGTFDAGQRYTITIANPNSQQKPPPVDQRSTSVGTGPAGLALLIIGGVSAASACIVTPLAAQKPGEIAAGSAICGGGGAMAVTGLILLGIASPDKPSPHAMISVSPSINGLSIRGRF